MAAGRDDEARDRRPPGDGPALGRRTLVLRVSAAAALAVPAAVVAASGEAEAQGAQISPYGPPPRRRQRSGVTDGDPSDAPGDGRGRRYYSAPPPRRVTDSDPYDSPGRGRGYSAPRRVTDNDPYDAPGRGRGY